MAGLVSSAPCLCADHAVARRSCSEVFSVPLAPAPALVLRSQWRELLPWSSPCLRVRVLACLVSQHSAVGRRRDGFPAYSERRRVCQTLALRVRARSEVVLLVGTDPPDGSVFVVAVVPRGHNFSSRQKVTQWLAEQLSVEELGTVGKRYADDLVVPVRSARRAGVRGTALGWVGTTVS
eukprot:9002850-Pyramimonas_sp.AAC.1